MKTFEQFDIHREIDPYGEEDWSHIYDANQREYLRRVRTSLDQFRDAYRNLNYLWSLDDNYNIYLNDLLTPMYPFHCSFDELGIGEWIEDFDQRAGNL